MKVLKYDRVKGTAPVQSSNRLTYITGNSGADISAINQRLAMLESTVLRLSNEIEKKQEYLRKGGDSTNGAFTFGSVRADRFDTIGRVEIFENSDDSIGYVRIKGFGNSSIPFVAKQGDYTYIEATPRQEVKGTASVEGDNVFAIESAKQGMQIKFKVGYNTPSLPSDFKITNIRAFVGFPIVGPDVPRMLSPSVGGSSSGEPTDPGTSEGQSHIWYECDLNYKSNTATFTLPFDVTSATNCAVRVEVYYTFLTYSEISSATINAWYDGTWGTTTFTTLSESKQLTATQDYLQLMKDYETGYQLRADGLFKTTDGVNWVKVV